MMSFINVLERLRAAATERQRGMTAGKAIVSVDDLRELLHQFGREDRFSRHLYAENETLKAENHRLREQIKRYMNGRPRHRRTDDIRAALADGWKHEVISRQFDVSLTTIKKIKREMGGSANGAEV